MLTGQKLRGKELSGMISIHNSKMPNFRGGVSLDAPNTFTLASKGGAGKHTVPFFYITIKCSKVESINDMFTTLSFTAEPPKQNFVKRSQLTFSYEQVLEP